MSNRAATALAAALVVTAMPAAALDVSGRVSASTIYSDNIRLASDGSEEEDLMFRVDPTVVISSIGRRYDFQLEYTLEALYYSDLSDNTEVYSQGSTTLDLEILEEHLFLNSEASISQVVVDPERPFSFTNVPQTSNRSDAVRYQTGPEWRQEILDSSLVVRYDIGHVAYDQEELQDSDYQNLNTDLTSPDKDRGLSWSAHHEYRRYQYDESEDAKRQLAELSLILNLSGGWAPFVSGGLESDVKDRTDAALTEGIWRAGLRRTTVRTSFEAFAGERSFGSSWGASFERQYGADSGDIFRIAYREAPRTSEDLEGSRRRPTDPPGSVPPGTVVPPGPVVPPGVVSPGSGQYFLSKRGDVVLARSFSRNAVSLNLFYEENQNLEEGVVADSDTTRQTGVSFAWVYQFGARTSAILEGFGARREFSRISGTDDEDTLARGRVGLRYQLGERTEVTGWVAHDQRRSADIESHNYSENQVGLSVGRTF